MSVNIKGVENLQASKLKIALPNGGFKKLQGAEITNYFRRKPEHEANKAVHKSKVIAKRRAHNKRSAKAKHKK